MQTRKLIILLSIYAIIFIVLVTYTTLPEQLRKIERSIELQTIVDVDKLLLFEVMADVENYPSVLQENYVSVKILNKTRNVIHSLETVKEAGIQTTFQVKHTIIPYQSHQISILDGDAQGTNIIVWFNDFGPNRTQISAKLDLRLKGIMYPFVIIPDQNINNAFNTVLNSFIEYLDIFESKKTELIITEYYNKYLHRAPDEVELQHWKNAILNDGIWPEWVRDQIRKSPEALEIKNKE